MAVAKNVEEGVVLSFIIFDNQQMVHSSLWIVPLLSIVFVQPYCGGYPQVIFCVGVGDGVVFEVNLFVCVVFFIHLLVSINPGGCGVQKKKVNSVHVFGLTESRWL